MSTTLREEADRLLRVADEIADEGQDHVAKTIALGFTALVLELRAASRARNETA